MKLHHVKAVLVRQLFLLRKNFTRFINIFLWLSLDVIVWGFTTKYLSSVGESSFSFIPVFLGAIILFGFLVRAQQGITLPFFEDVWSRNFLNLFASPLKINEYILGLVSTSILTGAASIAVVVILASAAFHFSLFSLGLPLLLFLLIIFIFGLSLGIATISLVLRVGPSAEWFSWIIPFILNPLSGVLYPISVLPGGVQVISKLIPTSYVFEGLREIVLHQTFSAKPLLIGLALAIFYLCLAYTIFVHTFKIVRRNGLLARFSSEI